MLTGSAVCSHFFPKSFVSKNCMRELVASTSMQKAMIALVDPDTSHGGLSLEDVRARLLDTDGLLYEKWGFNQDGLRAQALYDHLFSLAPIEWNRIGHFQDVTMRQIAERLLPDGVGTTYVDGEIVGQKVKPLKPLDSGHHVYCSALNLGAIELMAEVSLAKNITMQLDSQGQNQETNTLYVTTQAGCMARCDHMVLYLTGRTWTRGAASRSLGEEVMRAMDDGIHILLAHEMTGAGGQETRFGCEFGDFFGHPDGATPHELLKRGIYSEIAVPLKGGAWREASMMLLAMALGMSKEQIVASKAGEDVLGLDEATVAWVGIVLKESPQRFIRKSTRSFRIALGANKSTRTTVAISVSETSASAADVQDSGIELAI